MELLTDHGITSDGAEVRELGLDCLLEVVEVRAHLGLGKSGRLELHLRELLDDVALQGVLDHAHGDLLLRLGGVLQDLEAALVELDDTLHHAHSFVHWAVVIVLREGVLLQEFVLNDGSSL